MKKITLLFAVLSLIGSSAIAQFSKGETPPKLIQGNLLLSVTSTISLDGTWGSELMSLGFTSTKHKYGSDPAEDAYKCTHYNFLPRAGYFVIDNLAVGIEVILGGYKEKSANDYDNWSESMFGIGPFARYYYPLDKFYPFAEVEAIVGSEKSGYNDNDYKTGLFLVGVYLGAAFPLGEKVTFDAEIGYAHATFTHKGSGVEDLDSKEITGGVILKAGFSVYLPIK